MHPWDANTETWFHRSSFMGPLQNIWWLETSKIMESHDSKQNYVARSLTCSHTILSDMILITCAGRQRVKVSALFFLFFTLWLSSAHTWYMRNPEWYQLGVHGCLSSTVFRPSDLESAINPSLSVNCLDLLLWKLKQVWIYVTKGIKESLKKIQCFAFRNLCSFRSPQREKVQLGTLIIFWSKISYLWGQVLVRQVSRLSSACITWK